MEHETLFQKKEERGEEEKRWGERKRAGKRWER